MAETSIRIADAAGAADLEAVRALLTRYAEEQGFKLCFQGFDRELAGLPGDYAEPEGSLLLARAGGAAAGVVALKPLGSGAVELKRLYVRPDDRGGGLGRRLAEAALARARAKGYREIVLETLDSMVQARGLYAALGFRSRGRDPAGIERCALAL
jgi:ribosomal protein S18 acetylase RimI-like enzyme